jgi:hypothetical protein
MGPGRPQSWRGVSPECRPPAHLCPAHEPLTLQRRHRHGGAAAQPQHDREQPREREHPRLQAQQDRVSGPALPEAPRGPAPRPAAATSSRPESRSATARVSPPPPRSSPRASSMRRAKNSTSRSRATVSSRCSARRHHRLHPRRLVQAFNPRVRSSRSTACRFSAASSPFRLGAIREHFRERPGNGAERHRQPELSPQRSRASPIPPACAPWAAIFTRKPSASGTPRRDSPANRASAA